MKDKIKETKKLKIEVGFALCSAVHNTATDKEDSRIISKGTECTGTKCSVKAGRCREDQINIGNYHTHPKSHPTMSITDMVTGCSEEIECIGSALFNNISCFVRKTEESQCLNDTSPFEEEEHKILEKGEEIRTILRNPRSIIRTGIPKILREISQYDTHIAKYHKNRFKLLDNNFNRINIT
jgi:proteasome lid subunit RPN8/RPN11